MDIHFLGVGEACDRNQPNTSILLKTGQTETTGRILLDCGFSVPHRYFSLKPDPHELEVLWISHFHGDHFFGTPLLLLWFWEMGRHKKLEIAGPPGVESKIIQALELAYPNLLPRLGFSLRFIEVEQEERINIADTMFQAAYNEHSQPCLSLRLEFQGKTIFYSGDGRPTQHTQTLARGCDIIIHEAYGIEDTTPGHGSITACLEFCRITGVKQLALLHMQRDIRLQAHIFIEKLAQEYTDIHILLPEKGTIIKI